MRNINFYRVNIMDNTVKLASYLTKDHHETSLFKD